jgi:hypothetical protein
VPAQYPELAGARRRSASINSEWLSGRIAAIAAQFADIDNVEEIERRATAWLTDPCQVQALLQPLINALAADPWFEPPFKVSRDRLRTGIALLDCPAVALSVTTICAAELNRLPLPATVVMPGRVTLTHYVRAGKALMRRWRAAPAARDFSATGAASARELSPHVLKDSALIRQDGRTSGHLFVRAEGDIVALTATIKPSAAPLIREYAIADGSLVRVACADEAASRIEMLLTFLRVSGRTDASAIFDSTSRHPAFHLRWSAMREWLMLDGYTARTRLAEMCAHDANAEVRAAAAATLPLLDRRLEQRCRA